MTLDMAVDSKDDIKAQAKRKKKKQALEFIKIKNVCAYKVTIKKVKRQPPGWAWISLKWAEDLKIYTSGHKASEKYLITRAIQSVQLRTTMCFNCHLKAHAEI